MQRKNDTIRIYIRPLYANRQDFSHKNKALIYCTKEARL